MDNVYGIETLLSIFFVICLIGGLILLVKLALVVILGVLGLVAVAVLVTFLAGVVKGARDALARR